MKVRCFAVFAVLLGAILSCSDSTRPAPTLTGTYRLLSVDGEYLPATFSGASQWVSYLSGTLTVDASGRYSETDSFRYGAVMGDTMYHEGGLEGPYEVRGDSIFLMTDCPGLCPPYEAGTIDTGTVRVSSPGVSPPFEFVYKKLVTSH